jgi:hypothetical protein
MLGIQYLAYSFVEAVIGDEFYDIYRPDAAT